MYTRQKQKTPVTWENVPEVGLELHSNPRKHCAPTETCGIRLHPTLSEAQGVPIVHTPLLRYSGNAQRGKDTLDIARLLRSPNPGAPGHGDRLRADEQELWPKRPATCCQT
jgi:hypothetical protein